MRESREQEAACSLCMPGEISVCLSSSCPGRVSHYTVLFSNCQNQLIWIMNAGWRWRSPLFSGTCRGAVSFCEKALEANRSQIFFIELKKGTTCAQQASHHKLAHSRDGWTWSILKEKDGNHLVRGPLREDKKRRCITHTTEITLHTSANHSWRSRARQPGQQALTSGHRAPADTTACFKILIFVLSDLTNVKDGIH